MRHKSLCLVLVVLATLHGNAEGKQRGNVTQSSKKGLVIPNWPRHRCGDFQAFSTVSWWYNYLTQPTPESPYWCACPEGSTETCLPDPEDNYHFIPMVIGIPGYGKYANWTIPDAPDWANSLLGFNEPNIAAQSDIPPDVAAEAWIELQEKYPDKVLIAPGTTHPLINWFEEFWDRCQVLGCRIDYIATHMYDGDADVIMNQLEEYSRKYGNKKVWFTEFAKYKDHDEAAIVAFIEDILPRLEAAPFIWKYSWFITRYYEEEDMSGDWWLDPINSLLQFDSSELTAVGRAYDVPYHELV